MIRSPLPTHRFARPLALLAVLGLGLGAALAGDITVTPTAGGAFAVKNAGNSADRLRVGEDGTVLIPAAASGAEQPTPMCSGPGGIVGPCAPNAGGGGDYSAGTGLSLSGTAFSVAPPYRLPQACAAGTVLQSTGPGAWACVALPGGGGGGGTVTSIATGTGLSGGPITTSGTVALQPSFQLPQACAGGEVAQWDGAAWSCAALPAAAALPAGTLNGTLRHDGTGWVANDRLLADPNGGLVSWGVVSGQPVPAFDGTPHMMWHPGKAAFRVGYKEEALSAEDVGFASFAAGYDSIASDEGATAMGTNTVASGFAATAMGTNTTASGTTATAMGDETTASGTNATAMGFAATATHRGSFVWSGSKSSANAAESPAEHSFTVYAQGGINMFAGDPGSGGCVMSNPGSAGWACSSDRNLKTAITPADPRAVLDQLLAMPVSHWSFKDAPQYRHIGPMAQDFKAAFDLGSEDDRHISSMDAQGVALAAIQGLNARLEERSAQLAGQLADKDRQLTELRATVQAQQARLGELQALAAQLHELRTQVGALQAAQPGVLLTAARP